MKKPWELTIAEVFNDVANGGDVLWHGIRMDAEKSQRSILENGFKFSGNEKSLTPYSISFFDKKNDAARFGERIVGFKLPVGVRFLDYRKDRELGRFLSWVDAMKGEGRAETKENLFEYGGYVGVIDGANGGVEYRIYCPDTLKNGIIFSSDHKSTIQKAIAEGKPVPAAVIAEMNLRKITPVHQYELTLQGFYGGTDETDDLVLWVASDLDEDNFLKWLDALELKSPAGDNLVGNVYVLDMEPLTVGDGLDFRLPEQTEEFVSHVREKCEEANNPVFMQIKKAREDVDQWGEMLGDVESQYKSECAAFGDAGPGQWHNVCSLREKLAKAEEALDKLMETPEGIALKAKEDAEREKIMGRLCTPSGPQPF